MEEKPGRGRIDGEHGRLDRVNLGRDLQHVGFAREKAVALASINENPKNAAKPDDIKEKMVTGKLRKFFEERALLEQKFVKDPGTSVRDLVAKKGKELGGDIKIAWFVRQVVGE